jgi:hypothetical protein
MAFVIDKYVYDSAALASDLFSNTCSSCVILRDDDATTGFTDAVDAMQNALDVLPEIGSAHPTQANFRVSDVKILRMEGPQQCRAIINYVDWNAVVTGIRISSVIEYVPSNYDVKDDGTLDAPVGVVYDATVLDANKNIDPGSPSATNSTQIGELTIPIPRLSVRITRTDVGPPEGYASHYEMSRAISGRTNSETFWSEDPDSWLCTGVENNWKPLADYSGSTPTFNVWESSIEFVFKEEGWYQLVAYIDSNTGRPNGNVGKPSTFSPGSAANGAQVFQIAGQVDFTTLGLPDITEYE